MDMTNSTSNKCLNDSKMTFQDVFKFAFSNYVIWGEMAKRFGEEEFIDELKKYRMIVHLKQNKKLQKIFRVAALKLLRN